MPYYRKYLSYKEIAPYVQRLRVWLRTNCPVVKEYEEYGEEAFFFDETTIKTAFNDFRHYLYVLQNANFAHYVPYVADNHVGCLIINERADGEMPTVSRSHIRLPKIEHLMTLTPNDFFNMMKLISNTPISAGLTIIVNPAIINMTSIEESALFPFFQKVKTNYRMNADYADKKWTKIEDIKFIAGLEPTRDNQFSALQYLSSQRRTDLLYFPVETVIQLELDWQQVTDEYCVPNT